MLKWEPQNSTKSHKSGKNFSSKRIPDRGFKKTPFRRGQTPEFDDSYTLSADFSGAQGSQKGVEINSKWHLRAPQKAKNQEKWALKKTLKNNATKTGFWCAFWAQKRTFFRVRSVLKIRKFRHISKMGPRFPKWAPGTLKEPKIMNLTTQNQEKTLEKRARNQENPRDKMARWRVMRAAHW